VIEHYQLQRLLRRSASLTSSKSVFTIVITRLALLFLPFVFASCATITRGPHDKLYVQSEPSGAEAKLSSGEKAITPAKFVKNRRESFSVTVSKPGYISQTVRVESKVSATGGTAMAGNIVAGGLVGMAVDAGTGALYSLYPNPVVVQLAPAHAASPRKRSVRSTIQHKKDNEIKLQPRTSSPTTPDGQNGQGNKSSIPAPSPSEPAVLQSVEPPKPSPSP
jgi:hypothetical protein